MEHRTKFVIEVAIRHNKKRQIRDSELYYLIYNNLFQVFLFLVKMRTFFILSFVVYIYQFEYL
jgi:hypothetical protein